MCRRVTVEVGEVCGVCVYVPACLCASCVCVCVCRMHISFIKFSK